MSRSVVVKAQDNNDNPGRFPYCLSVEMLDVMGNNKTILKLMKLRRYGLLYEWDNVCGWVRL